VQPSLGQTPAILQPQRNELDEPMADEKNTRPRAQSSELGAGTGFTFEDAVGAFFLTALLSEGYAPGIENRIVRRVSFQRKTFGEPLDDLIIDFTRVTAI
jgi:hypothetical protein